MTLHILFESASGYALFERVKSEEIGLELPEVQKSIVDLKRFSKIMKLKSFLPFTSAEDALENINAVSEGELTKTLGDFLELHLPRRPDGKPPKVVLGVVDPKIGNAISENLGIKCSNDDVVEELIRGIRLHFDRFIKGLEKGEIRQAQLGLGHSYSRSKVKFNVHRVDNMIIQSIALLDQLDKDLNTFAMRVREWYSWHFPELIKVVNDNYKFCKLAKLIKNKSNLLERGDELLPEIVEVLEDEDQAKQVIEAAKMSMGTDISPIDMINIEQFATRVVSLTDYRKSLHDYLVSKMNACAPNLTALIGEHVGARLIAHAGSLTNLAKYPASTVQILGAEKALFRALKTKGNTPKYGLIFHSSFIGKAGAKNKGRISRYLANKCSIASRIDSFSDVPSNEFGSALKSQVEERLEFYKSGTTPRKNVDVMAAAANAAAESAAAVADSEGKKKKKKKAKQAEPEAAAEEPAEELSEKKQKKKRRAEAEAMEVEAEPEAVPEKPKKNKKSKVVAEE